MLSFYLISALCYFFLLWGMSRYWSKNVKENSEGNLSKSVSLLISLRNESENLPQLRAAILRVYDSLREILLVDDHSEDDTLLLLQGYFQNDPKIQVLSNPGFGKKSAINFAISRASGELLVTTDADCNWNPDWIEQLKRHFQSEDIQLVAGPVLSSPGKNLLERFQLLEWASILLVSNFSFKIGKPLTCSAANMAFRKTAFVQVNGFQGNEENPSGDDEFLLKKMIGEFGAGSVRYFCSGKSLVLTSPEKTWSSLVNQKVRWAGKWKSHSSGFHVFSSLLPVFFQLIWVFSFLLLSQGKAGILAFCVMWIFKILAERLSFDRILRSLEKPFPLSDLIATSFIHPIYLLAVAIRIVKGTYIWKGRLNGREELKAEISGHD
jgi:poly-beta-1,6-N-acetyl-D-glucosamine synthase